jgi:hypothetical protein
MKDFEKLCDFGVVENNYWKELMDVKKRAVKVDKRGKSGTKHMFAKISTLEVGCLIP